MEDHCCLQLLNGWVWRRQSKTSEVCSDRMRGNRQKSQPGKLQVDSRKKCFTMQVVKHQNRLLWRGYGISILGDTQNLTGHGYLSCLT